jgi:hypothetical protein
MSIAKNQKKTKKEKKENKIFNRFFYVEFSRNFKLVVDFLIECVYYLFQSVISYDYIQKLIDLLKFEILNSFYLN